MPSVTSVLVEEAEPDAPYGAKGVGEPPVIASPAAIAAAMRDASGRRLGRIPVLPDELAGIAETEPERWIKPGEAP
jgi:CO/xanthine dehydrogenase Mo-binding subunit